KANIHLDMVGGGPATHAVFHITRGPMSLPSFINDVAESIGEWVNDQTYKFAATGESEFPLIARDGTKDPLRADFATFTMGSDHEVYADSSWSIPTIYLNDWPDWNIHTNFDTAAMIDPTKLKRAAFIAGTSGWVLANSTAEQTPALVALISERGFTRTSDNLRRLNAVGPTQKLAVSEFHVSYEKAIVNSLNRFFPFNSNPQIPWGAVLIPGSELVVHDANGDGGLIFHRRPEPKGPVTAVFGYNYLEDHIGKGKVAKLSLLKYQGLWGAEDEYAYECLNFVNGRRDAMSIRDALTAEYGPVDIHDVVQYLRALESVGIVEQVK